MAKDRATRGDTGKGEGLPRSVTCLLKDVTSGGLIERTFMQLSQPPTSQRTDLGAFSGKVNGNSLRKTTAGSPDFCPALDLSARFRPDLGT